MEEKSQSYNRRQFKKPAPTYETAGRIMPQDKDVEEAVLGALMLEKDAYTTVCDILKPASFYEPKHQRIYEAIQSLGVSQQPIDMLTVVEQLRRNGTLEEIGGPVVIAELTSRVASGANVEFHARIVAQNILQENLFRLQQQ